MKLFFSIFVALSWGLFLVWAMGGQAFSSVDMLLRTFGLDGQTMTVALVIAAVSSAVVFYACWQLTSNRFNRTFWRTMAGCYFVMLLAIVMLKSVGVREINLDVADLLPQLAEYPISVIANLLLFVPAGALAAWKFRKPAMTLSLALAAIVAVEAVQYILALGIADVVDVAVDFTGFCAGYGAVDTALLAGLRLVHNDDDSSVRCVRTAMLAPSTRTILCKRAAIATTVFAAILVALGVALASYEHDPYAFMDGMTPEEFEAAMLAGKV